MLQVLVAALLSGLSVPVSRLLLVEISPVLMSALLYLGSAGALIPLIYLRPVVYRNPVIETRLKSGDLPWLAGSILFGGIFAPVLLMYSLPVTPAATASLLLNFESVATTLLAVAIFKESVGRRVYWAIVLITAGGVLLSMNTGNGWGISIGAIGIIGTAFCWGIDNNLTRRISAKDPFAIGGIKGLVSGLITLTLAFILHEPLPGTFVMLEALALGSISYGIALALFISSLRFLGAARTSALFGTAPFWGVLLAFFVFREIHWLVFISLPLMALGTLLLLGEKEIIDQ